MPHFDWEAICGVARLAGQAILEVYGTEFAVEYKADNSPLTQADRASQEVIARSLEALHPDVPMLSEESAQAPYAERKAWKRFWLVDPLDGTKEFVKRNGEFTVNIALVEGRAPAFGVLYVPVKDVLYAGGPGLGAWKMTAAGRQPLAVSGPMGAGGKAVVVKSRSHPDEKLAAYLAKYPNRLEVTAGSALKFGLVAEGTANLYPRFNPTWEWDTAAGHAIILGAGGGFRAADGGPFLYNKENLLNGGFEATGWL